MCCFSGPVSYVNSTNIFAREEKDNRQYLAYAMSLGSDKDVAMILPLPIPANTPEDAVQFIDLHEYPELFTDLYHTVNHIAKGRARNADEVPVTFGGGVLEVKQVGSFEASFVPKIADFARLDERFRLPENTWEQLPAYKNFGFAVFKFKAGKNKVHPMAFSFPRADATRLFFPTVHIHDGKVHAEAEFDHTLYAQIGKYKKSAIPNLEKWRESHSIPRGIVKTEKAKKIIDANVHVYSIDMKGKLKNQDTYVSIA